MTKEQRKAVATFATAYAAMGDAMAAGDNASHRVWAEIYVAAADKLGLKDEDHIPLADLRRSVAARDAEFLAQYRGENA